MSLNPATRPMQPREVTAALLNGQGVKDPVALLGERGFFDTGENERGIYDDAIFLTSPTCHVSFNANVDPSFFQPGVASLEPGLWRFSLSVHGKSKPPELQYPCLEQSQPVVVRRDGTPPKPAYLDKGMFAIQIHRGSFSSTSSLGCQTIWPDQYDSFIALVKDQLRRYNQGTIPYLLRDR